MQAAAPYATSYFSFKVHEFRLQLNLAEFFKPGFSSPAGRSHISLPSSVTKLLLMGPDHTSLSPIYDTTREIFLLAFLLCPVSQAVSLHWFIPSNNTKLRSLLSTPCDCSAHSPSHQKPAHNGGQPPFYHVFGNAPQKTPQNQSLVETHLCSQYLHTGHVATQHIGKYHFPSPRSYLSEPPIFLCLNLGIASVRICCIAQLSPAAASCPMATGTRNNNRKMVTH